jgi:tetratricopeptide (TPR) repeat protein
VAGVLEDEDRVRAQLRTLVEQGIIEPGDPAADTYRFRHALMRDAAYETQVLDARKQTHAKVAEVLSARGAEPALVAAHLDLAGEAAQAVGLYLVAVQSEQGRGAHQEAGELATRAIELAATLPESHDRDLGELTARMLRAFSVSSMKGYAAPEVQDDHRSAEVLATKLGKVPQVVPSLIASWGFWFSSGSLETSRRILDRLTELVGDPAFASFVPEVEVVTGYQDWYEGHLDLAEAHVHRAVVAYDARSSETLVSPFWILPNDPVAVALIALACIKTLRGEPGAQEWEDKAIRRAEEIGFPRGPFSRAFVKLYTAWNRRFLGDSEGAWKLGSEIVAIGQEHGYAFWIAMGAGYLATDQAPSAAEHRAFLRQAIATLDLMGQEAFKAFNLSYLAGLHAAAGELERALELVGEGIQVVHTSGELLHLPELLRQRAVYSLGAGGDPDEAVAGLEEAVRVATEQGSRITQLRAALDLARLPVELRPADWRRVLAEARNGLAPGVAREETTAADALLDTVPLAD